ncbi:MAG: hypothetical protein H6728_15070 [Myxococcales bacterium]|nr:hypothetical protein [Myxococcales bacterium]
MQPNSKEFFSRVDPSFRSYGKQQALAQQKLLLEQSPKLAQQWQEYLEDQKLLTRWILKTPPNEQTSASSKLPFQHQGQGKFYTYKLFMELAFHLLRDQGRLAMLVPASFYNDKGALALRKLFLNSCRWEWLFSFENRAGIFSIDNRFKFCAIIVQKGGKTDQIQTAFMQRHLKDWEDAEKHAVPYTKKQIQTFSPKV